MGIIQWCGISILCAVLIMILRALRVEAAPFVSLAGSSMLLLSALLLLTPFFSFVTELAQEVGFAKEGKLLLKMFGIGTLVTFCADICREMGEGSVANQLEFLGRAELMLLSLPALQELLSVCRSLL